MGSKTGLVGSRKTLVGSRTMLVGSGTAPVGSRSVPARFTTALAGFGTIHVVPDQCLRALDQGWAPDQRLWAASQYDSKRG